MRHKTSNKPGYTLPRSCTACCSHLVHGAEEPGQNRRYTGLVFHTRICEQETSADKGGSTLLTYPPFMFPAKTLLQKNPTLYSIE